MKFKTSLTSALLMVLTLFLYQNCSRVEFKGKEYDPWPRSQNGELYSGKPVRSYYRFIADFTCEGDSAPVSTLDVL